MVELLVIADDFTGALDTGVQFAEAGAATEVIVNDVIVPSDLSKQVETLVIDTESRHLCANGMGFRTFIKRQIPDSGGISAQN